jgi:RNA recognition motif-containing protein
MEKESKESKVLYVGGLPEEFSNRDFESVLSEYAGVEKCFVIKNRGWGLVFFSTDKQASEALKELQETEIEGNLLRVDYANKKKE